MFMVMKTKFTYQNILKNVVGVVKYCRIGEQMEIGNLNDYEKNNEDGSEHFWNSSLDFSIRLHGYFLMNDLS